MPEDRRLAAIMFTDIVGYTALMGKDEDHAIEILAINQEIHKTILSRYNGTLIKEMGDGILASFSSNSDAVRCAIEIQQEAKAENIRLRIGIHEGEMVFAGSDVLGDGVNVASRLQEVSQDGCVSISGKVFSDIKNKAGINTKYIGERKLKNVEDPVKVYEVLCEGEEKKISSNKEQISNKNQITKRRKPHYFIITGLVVVIAAILIWQFLPMKDTSPPTPDINRGLVDTEKSIAVLPFRNLSNNTEDQYLADGMMESILNHLQKIEDLSVRSSTSTQQFRDPDRNISEIGKSLNANYILEGSFQKVGNKANLIVQLIMAETDEHIWADEYNRDWSDIFTVQSEVAKTIAAELVAAITPEEKQNIDRIPTNNLEAYNLYLWGMYHINKNTKEDFEISIDYFDSAINLDPGFALAYAAKGQSYQYLVRSSFMARSEGHSEAKKAILKALDLDPSLGQAHATLGLIMIVFDWDIYGPEQEFQKAINLSPGSHEVYRSYGEYLRWFGKYDKSITNIKKALELDPLTPMTNVWLGLLYSYAGRYDESIQQLKKVHDLDPNNIHAHYILSVNYTFKEMFENAIDHADMVMSFENTANDPTMLAGTGWVFAKAGIEDQARKQLGHMLDLSGDQIVDPIHIAFIYTGLGDIDEAFTWLSRGVEERSGAAIYLRGYGDWILKDLSSDPRYNELLHRIGFKED